MIATIKLARFKFVAKMLSPEDVVLDIGCGKGLSTNYFSFFCKSVTGLDLYSDLDAAKREFGTPSVKFMKRDLLSPPDGLDFPGVNVVTHVDVIEHFHRDDGIQIIANFANLLPAGGMMIAGTPSKYSQQYRSEKSRKSHFYEWKPSELREEMDKHFARTLLFCMNDEIVHTGFEKMAWFFFVIGVK